MKVSGVDFYTEIENIILLPNEWIKKRYSAILKLFNGLKHKKKDSPVEKKVLRRKVPQINVNDEVS